MTDSNAPWYLRESRTRRVLAVADDDRLRESLTRGLNRHKFEVVSISADSDLRHVTAASDEAPGGVDVVLVDVPSGEQQRALACLRRLRDRGVNVPAVCLAHPADVVSLGAGVAATIASVLIKPIDMAELAAELGRACRSADRD